MVKNREKASEDKFDSHKKNRNEQIALRHSFSDTLKIDRQRFIYMDP